MQLKLLSKKKRKYQEYKKKFPARAALLTSPNLNAIHKEIKEWDKIEYDQVYGHNGLYSREKIVRYSKTVTIGPALCLAAKRGLSGSVKLLVENNADVNLASSEDSPLMLAIKKGDHISAKILIDAKVDVTHKQLLVSAIHLDRTQIVFDLIDAGAKVNYFFKLKEHSYTPLLLAAKMNKESMVAKLLAAGATLNELERYESQFAYYSISPLMHAYDNNNPKMIKSLLDVKATIKMGSDEGLGMLYRAVDKNDLTMAKILLEAKVNPNDKSEMTPLLIAAQKNNLGMVNLLLDYKADVNAHNKGIHCYDYTILHYSVKNNNLKMMETFLESKNAKINVDDRDDNGRTALILAVENNI